MGKVAETPPDLRRLRDSWLIELRAQRRAPATLRAYRIGTDLFLGAHAELTKPAVVEWLAGFDGAEPATVRLRLAAVKQFARWLGAGGTEGGLMAQAGWRDRAMLDRYVSHAREQLAAEEFDRLALDGD